MKIETKDCDKCTVGEAFAGKEKIERIKDNLKQLIDNSQANYKSDIIKLAIELYADTTEQAVGIALEVNHLIETVPKAEGIADALKRLFNGEKDPKVEVSDPFLSGAEMFETLEKKEKERTKPDLPEFIKDLTKKAMEMRTGSVKEYMSKNHQCETCPMNGECPIQDIADGADPSWREGRSL